VPHFSILNRSAENAHLKEIEKEKKEKKKKFVGG
jgi:hypothetical protein